MDFLFLLRTDDDNLSIRRVHGESTDEIGGILHSELSKLTIDECYTRVGSAIVEELRTAGVQLELPDQPQLAGPLLGAASVAHYLIQRSVGEKTNSYVAAIDALLTQGEDEEVAALIKIWPTIRARLETFDGSLGP